MMGSICSRRFAIDLLVLAHLLEAVAHAPMLKQQSVSMSDLTAERKGRQFRYRYQEVKISQMKTLGVLMLLNVEDVETANFFSGK